MKFIATILFSFMATVILAHGNPTKNSVVIKGFVNEITLGESLTGVKVSVVGSDIYTYTDRDGFFELTANSDSEIKIQFALVSFEPRVVNVPASNADELIEVTLLEK